MVFLVLVLSTLQMWDVHVQEWITFGQGTFSENAGQNVTPLEISTSQTERRQFRGKETHWLYFIRQRY